MSQKFATFPITAIEDAIIERLQNGLGKLVCDVLPYSGQFDGDLSNIVRRVPAVFVSFGGAKTSVVNTTRQIYRNSGTFVVVCMDYSSDNLGAKRGNGNSIGTHGLVWAIRRLLTRQDLDLPISHLEPVQIKVLFDTEINGTPFSAYELEFSTDWHEHALKSGGNPKFADAINAPDTPNVPDSGANTSAGDESHPGQNPESASKTQQADSRNHDDLLDTVFAGQVDERFLDKTTLVTGITLNYHFKPDAPAAASDNLEKKP